MKTIDGIWKIIMASVIILTIITVTVSAQSSSPINYNRCSQFFLNNPIEKLYLHTDRDIYAENDTIWFKAYLVNAHILFPDRAPLRNIYVELISRDKETVIRNMIAMKEGTSFGDFVLTDYNIKKGRYKLRAYTRYQTNFGEAFLFEKNILITPVFDQQTYDEFYDSVKTDETQTDTRHPEIDMQFFPEGGVLTSGLTNTLAIKAVNGTGYGVDVSGAIYENDTTKITDFRTSHLGMGAVLFKPEAGKVYYAKLVSNSTHYPIPPSTDLLLMKVTNDYADSLVAITLRTNQMDNPAATYYIVITCAGLVKFSARIPVNTAYKKFKIPYSKLSTGINQITLLDSNLVPLRDRLIFVDKGERLNVQVTTDKETYHPFDSVSVAIRATTPDGNPVKDASLSVSVTDQSLSKPLSEHEENIYTWLLLSSDLKGCIEKPAYYFDDQNPDAKDHLDLLMLTQGWSQYVWNPIIDSLPEIKYPKQYGIEMTGALNQIFLGKKLKKTKLTMSLMQDDKLFYDTITTDSNGNFSVQNMVLPDSVKVYFSCPGEKNRKQEVTVQTFSPEYPVTAFNNFPIPGKSKLQAFSHQASNRYIDDKTSHPEKYNVLIKEIVVNKKIDPTEMKDDHFRTYIKADKAFVPAEPDLSYQNVLSYLNRQMGRIKYYGGSSLYISGMPGSGPSEEASSGTPLLLLDGTEVDLIDLEVLPMSVVEKVEVLTDPTSLSIWPSDSKAYRNGVISVFTKTVTDYDTYTESQLVQILRGYYPSRKFYSPKYQAPGNTPKTDRRTTLLWAPIINTDEYGNARFSFFNTNNTGKMKIEIEGIAKDGRTAVKSKEYDVR